MYIEPHFLLLLQAFFEKYKYHYIYVDLGFKDNVWVTTFSVQQGKKIYKHVGTLVLVPFLTIFTLPLHMKSKASSQLMEKYPLQQGAHTKILRTVCAPITTLTKDIRQFGKDLIELMRAYDGVGLAAPQVGKAWRIAAFTQRDMSKKERELTTEDVMINPVILSASKDLVTDKEGCLSLPGIEGEVNRSKQITVKYLNLQGKDVIMKATGYNARIILHEIDHLDGVLFIDKMISEVNPS